MSSSCDKKASKAKARKEFIKNLVVGKRYPIKHAFQAGEYKFKVGDEFIFWGSLDIPNEKPSSNSKKILSFHYDDIPINFLLFAELFIE